MIKSFLIAAIAVEDSCFSLLGIAYPLEANYYMPIVV